MKIAVFTDSFYPKIDGIAISSLETIRKLAVKGHKIKVFCPNNLKNSDEIKIVPAYFPFTEPSCELHVKHPQLGWIELGGAGIFRPEVVIPLLGKDVPVLAWGLGMARTVAGYFNITDIRDLYKNDIKQLREIKSWMRT